MNGAPNAPQPTKYAPSEEEMLLAELAYSPAFRRFVELAVAPKVAQARTQLIRNPELSESDRKGYVRFVLEVEAMLETVYATTEAGTAPAWVQAIFR